MDWERFKRRAARWLVSDAAGLLILGSISIARGMSYTPLLVNPERKPTHFMESVLNPPSWAVVWLLMGGAVPMRGQVAEVGSRRRRGCCRSSFHVGVEFHFRHAFRRPGPCLGVLPRLHRHRRHDPLRLRTRAE